MASYKEDSSFNFEESLLNGNHIISFKVDKPYIDEKGNLQNKKVKKFNLMKSSGLVVCDRWFDVYRTSPTGEVIVGYEKTVEDYERTLGNYDLESIGPKLVPTEHGRMLIEGKSLEETVDQACKYSYGLINKDGNFVVAPIHDYIDFSTEDTCIVGRINHGVKYGYFDTIDGHQITPIAFYKANKFFCGLAIVKGLSRYRVVSREKVMTDYKDEEQYAFPKEFDCIFDYVDGKAQVRFGGSVYYIGTDGQIVSTSFVKRKI